jgi:hypothetical protein
VRTWPARRAVTLVWCLALAGCATLRPKPQIITKTDTVTVTVTKEVPPPLPNGDSVEVCLSTGFPAAVRITTKGDTLIGANRVPLSSVQPVLALAGSYAGAARWFTTSDTVRFERKLYGKAGGPRVPACADLKLVGSYQGVPVFADVTAPQVLPAIMIPVRPGLFQLYSTAAVPRSVRRR